MSYTERRPAVIIASLWAFMLSSFVLIVAIALKTKWFKLWPGWILAGYIGTFTLVGIYLLGRWTGVLSETWQIPFYTTTFGVLFVVNAVNTILLLRRNWNYWAWSK